MVCSWKSDDTAPTRPAADGPDAASPRTERRDVTADVETRYSDTSALKNENVDVWTARAACVVRCVCLLVRKYHVHLFV